MRRILLALCLIGLLSQAAQAGNLVSTSKTVTTAGTRVQLLTATTNVYWVDIQADCDNTGNIFVGDSTASSSVGITLRPCTVLPISPGAVARDALNLTNIWIDSSVNGEGVTINYWTYP